MDVVENVDVVPFGSGPLTGDSIARRLLPDESLSAVLVLSGPNVSATPVTSSQIAKGFFLRTGAGRGCGGWGWAMPASWVWEEPTV